MICEPCRKGRHSHDRYTMTGADAGCPNLVRRLPDGKWDGSAVCACRTVVPTVPPGRCRACGQVTQ